MDKERVVIYKQMLLSDIRANIRLFPEWKYRKFRDGLQKAIDIVERQPIQMMPEPRYIPAPPPKPAKPPECQHKFKDYDWYMNYGTTDGNMFRYEIYEPYVCVKCGIRKDVLLENGTHQFSGRDQYLGLIEELKRKYPKLRERAEVEDEVNDALLVDREYLRIVDILRGGAEVDKSIILRLNAARGEGKTWQ